MIYDVIVLGGGPGGYLAAERAGHAGLNVLLIEKRALGGTCLNEGCVPTKTFLYSAKIFDYANGVGSHYGVSVENPKIDHAFVVKRKNKVVKTLVGGVGFTMKQAKVTVKYAEAKLCAKTDDGFMVAAGGETFEGKNIIIATGSEAFVPPFFEGIKEAVESGFAVTNREILDLEEVPKEFVVIGGGVIGLELASYFNSVGSNVNVVEMLPKIAGPNDNEISKMLQKEYEKKGVKFHLNAKVTKILSDGIEYEQDGETKKLPADKVLLSIGRKANTKGLGLEEMGVELNRGAVVTDAQMKTNVPGIYAVGDVNGTSMLAHTAYREAEVAVNTILGIADEMKYNAIPGVIYTNPELGSVGYTEEVAKEKGINVKVVKLPMAYSGRWVAENEGGTGVCKLIVDVDTNKLVGAHILANYASEFIYGVAAMITCDLDLDAIKKIVFPHPTVSEIIREGIFMYK
ncbi:MAG: dihydrolipoyl dehydrogenase [Clostridia bacterium]|nr:dihydrolipoyl dehydrogenase [Clostridia bacterium]